MICVHWRSPDGRRRPTTYSIRFYLRLEGNHETIPVLAHPVTLTLVLLAACVAPMTPVLTQVPATQTSGPVAGYPDRLGCVQLDRGIHGDRQALRGADGQHRPLQSRGLRDVGSANRAGCAGRSVRCQPMSASWMSLAKKVLCSRIRCRTTPADRLCCGHAADSPVKLERLEDLVQPAIGKVAIANPDRAPYGLAAREALKAAGIWETIQPKLVIAETIQQTHQYAETGNVDAAIGALSLSVPAAAGDKPGSYVIVSQELYTPLDQALAVIKGTKNEAAARAFAAFITGPQGRGVLQKYGLAMPGGDK